MSTTHRKAIAMMVLLGSIPYLQAQETDSTPLRPTFELDYTSELQTDLKRSRQVNLLQLSTEVPLSKTFSFTVSSVSIASTDEEPLANDLQGYSNIDAENSPFALSVAGFTWCMNEHHSLFAGIRRVDEDYFCSDALSLFTNSSCGNFPTLSSNHDLATYPLAAMSIHYAYDNERFGAKASLYNGTGHQRFAGCENVFRICPHSDGISALGQIEYRHHGSQYFVGASLHEGKMEGENTQREICSTTWVHAEQALSPNLTLLASYAHVFSNEHPCRNFCGVGGRYVYKNTDWGIYSDYTRMDKVDEWATELTCNLICNANLSVQPVLHIITTDKHTKCVGMLRLNIGL